MAGHPGNDASRGSRFESDHFLQLNGVGHEYHASQEPQSLYNDAQNVWPTTVTVWIL